MEHPGVAAALAAMVAGAARDADPLQVASGVVRLVADAGGWEVPARLRVADAEPPAALTGPGVEIRSNQACPWFLGQLYEAALAPEARSTGAHYTPVDVAARLAALVLPSAVLRAYGLTGTPLGCPGEGGGDELLRVWDPACGGGVFLLAAADALLAAGGRADQIVSEQVWGTDTDPGAVAVAEASLCWWARRHGVESTPAAHLAVADPLIDEVSAVDVDSATGDHDPLTRAATAGFDVVIGNPPFQGQLAGPSVRTAAATAALRSRWGTEVVGPYTDTASLFLVAGARALAPGGRLLLVQPTSVLAARDAAGARAAATDVAHLAGLWVAGEPIFGAAVDVCAVVLERPGLADEDEVGPYGGGAGDERDPLATAELQARRQTGLEAEGVATVADPRARGMAPCAVERGTHGAGSDWLAASPAPVVRRWKGRGVEALATASAGSLVGRYQTTGGGGPWSSYALSALGVPDPPARFAGRLGSITTARAGFRDEYYGLIGHVVEATLLDDEGDGDGDDDCGDGGGTRSRVAGVDLPAGLAPLVTSGLIDPGRCAWGERPASFARTRYQRPAVQLASLAAAGGRAAAWVGSMAVPKVVVATQTQVGEAAVDERGRWVASTPTIAVVADADRLWEVAAVICSPVGTIAALAATAGTARAGGAIRHTVASVTGLPLPVDIDAWTEGTVALRCLDRRGFLAAMSAAYGLPTTAEVDDWWAARAPWPR